MANEIFTLFSSDSTVQYTKDVFSILSLPRNSIINFRYQAQHVDNAVKPVFENNQNGAGVKVLVAFRSSATTEAEKIFIVPVRWAVITSVKKFSDVFILSLKLQGYPSFSQKFRNVCATFAGINTYAKDYFVANNTELAVQPVQLDAVDLQDEIGMDTVNWRSIVEVLVNIPKYANYHFLKSTAFYWEKYNSQNKQIEHRDFPQRDDGKYVLTEGKCAYLEIDYYSKTYDQRLRRQIDVFLDENNIRKAKGLRTFLESRYGTVVLGFQPQKTVNNTVTEVTICTASEPADVIQTDVKFPIIIRKNRTYKIIKALIMGLGAGLVALPGLLGDKVDLWINIVIALSGVLVIGINNYLESKE